MNDNDVTVPAVRAFDTYQFATEVAYNTLVDQAAKEGLPIVRPMGLMYLPTQELTRNFIDACRAILKALETEPAATDAIAVLLPSGALCSDCPPPGYSTDKTRCHECPRRSKL